MKNVEDFLRAFGASIAAARMYAVNHPQVKEAVDIAYSTLMDILQDQDELVVGFVEDEIIYGQEVLFDLSTLMRLMIELVKKKEIEKIYLYKTLRKEELVHGYDRQCPAATGPGDHRSHAGTRTFLLVPGLHFCFEVAVKRLRQGVIIHPLDLVPYVQRVVRVPEQHILVLQ